MSEKHDSNFEKSTYTYIQIQKNILEKTHSRLFENDIIIVKLFKDRIIILH